MTEGFESIAGFPADDAPFDPNDDEGERMCADLVDRLGFRMVHDMREDHYLIIDYVEEIDP